MKIWHIFVFCVVLSAVGVSKSNTEETEYFAVFMEGKKIGYATQGRVVADEKVTTTQEVKMEINRAGTPMTVDTRETSIETIDGNPLGFKAWAGYGARTLNISGEVDSLWIVEATITSMGRKQKKSFGWPSGAVMLEGLRLLQAEKGFKEGLEYDVKLFSPTAMQAVDIKMQIGSKQNVDLLGRVVSLTEVKTIFKTPMGGEIVTTNYVGKDFRMLKSITPIMGAEVEMIACTKEFAIGDNDVVDVINKMFLASPEPLDNIESAEPVVYYLKPSGQSTMPVIPSSDNQSVQQVGRDGAVVTVKPVAAPKGAKFPYKGNDSGILEAMRPTSFVQSDYKEIIELAKRAVGDTKDAAEAVKKIESFVSGYIENRSLSVGYASAAEVAASKVGDCSEFAVLTASMCRAVGIPARVVFGLVYVKEFGSQKNVFGGHAWVEAYVGDKWVGIDAARMPKGFDSSHIAMAIGNGEPGDFFDLAATLGQFKIDKVTIGTEKAKEQKL